MAHPSLIPVEDGTELTVAAWRLLEAEGKDLGLPDLRIQPIADFLASAEQHRTSVADRQTIVAQATLIFDHLYPHMPFKTDLYQHPHPSDYMRQEIRPCLDSLTEIEFQSRLITAFSLVRDAHTLYGLPSPYRSAVAFLPFQIRPFLDHKTGWRFFVASVMNTQPDQGFGHPFFGTGVEIVRCGDIDILDHVERTAEHLPGGNYFAKLRRGAMHTTLRPLMFLQPPFADELPDAIIYYRPQESADVRAIRIPWAVGTGFGSHLGFDSAVFSMSPATAVARTSSKFLHHRPHLEQDRKAAADQISTIPEVFDFQYTGGPREAGYIEIADLADPARPDARFGYIRIKAFSDGSGAPGSTDRMVQEFRRILEIMDEKAPDGLVIDIRSNPGGDVQAAERMLQMLTPVRIEPARFHLANTPAVVDILRSLKDEVTGQLSTSDDVRLSQARAELEAWLEDAERAPLPEGDRLTSGRPLTDPDSANDIGHIYHGRGVALLINSLTYSAADIFAAGFQDHRVGVILGTSPVTGGGGANVWRHEDLMNKIGPRPGIPLAHLPGDASMTLAIRRCSRVGPSAGLPVEDEGVEADVFYLPDSVDDVIFGNPGILRRACEQLRDRQAFRVDVSNVAVDADGAITAEIRTLNIAALKFYVDGHPVLSTAPTEGVYRIPAAADTPCPSVLRVEGYAPDLIRARTIHLPGVAAALTDDFDPAMQSPEDA